MSVVTEEEVKTAIEAGLSPSFLKVEDLSGGCGAKFNLIVVSSNFDTMKLLQRHRAVHAALGPLKERIHALEIKAWTVAEFEEKKESL